MITRGLVAASRYIGIRIMLPDRPGQLARVAQVISDAGANVVEVLHTRHGQGLVINEVALDLSIEARGPEHARRSSSACTRPASARNSSSTSPRRSTSRSTRGLSEMRCALWARPADRREARGGAATGLLSGQWAGPTARSARP